MENGKSKRSRIGQKDRTRGKKDARGAEGCRDRGGGVGEGAVQVGGCRSSRRVQVK